MPTIEHKDVTSIHRFAYVSNTNPGAVGAYKAWVDTSTTPNKLKIRGASNAFWVDVGIWDQDILDIANLTPVNDDVIQRKGGVWTNRTVNQLKTDLNLVIGTNVQAYSAGLTAIGLLTTGADKLAYFNGVNSAATTTLTSFARTLLDDNTAGNARTTLGLGTIATQNADGVNITGGDAALDFEGLTLKSSAGSYGLLISATSVLTGARTLTLNVGDASRTVSLQGNLTVSSTATISGTNTGNELPSQTGNGNKVLITNGTSALWYGGVLSGGDVADSADRYDVITPRYIHVNQLDNSLSYILATTAVGTSTESDWIALPPAGRESFRTFVAQVTTGTPTMTTVENGLQGTPTWSRTNVGNYVLTLTGKFAANKFFNSGGVWYTNGTDTITYSLTRIDNNSARLFVTKLTASTSALIELSSVLSTYSLTSVPLEFYVYP